MLRQVAGGIHAHEGELLLQAVLQPSGEGGGAVVQAAGERRGIESRALGEARGHALEPQTLRQAHAVDRRAEGCQVRGVDEQGRREAAECECERPAPRLELGAHVHELGDEGQFGRRETRRLGERLARLVQPRRDVVVPGLGAAVLGLERGELLSQGGVSAAGGDERVPHVGLGIRVAEGAPCVVSERGELRRVRDLDAQRGDRDLEPVAVALHPRATAFPPAQLPLGGVQPVATGGTQHVAEPVSLRFRRVGEGLAFAHEGVGGVGALAQLVLDGAEQVDAPLRPPQRCARSRVVEPTERLDDAHTFRGVVDAGRDRADRLQRAHLLARFEHAGAGALEPVEVGDHGFGGGEGLGLLEHHALVEVVDGGDLLSRLDAGEKAHRLRPGPGGTDAEHGVQPRRELAVGRERVQTGRADGGIGQMLACCPLETAQIEAAVDRAAHLHGVVEHTGGRGDVPRPYRGEAGAVVVRPGHRDRRPGVGAVAAQYPDLRALVGARLVELAAAVGEDVALLLPARAPDDRAVGRAVERGGVRHHERDVGVHERGLARSGTSAQQGRGRREAHAVLAVVAAPVDQLELFGDPLLSARGGGDESEQRLEHRHAGSPSKMSAVPDATVSAVRSPGALASAVCASSQRCRSRSTSALRTISMSGPIR